MTRGYVRRLALGFMIAVTVSFAIGAGVAQASTDVQVVNTPGIPRSELTPADLDTNGKLDTRVMLPAGYSSRACWPVLYLLHGTGSYPDHPADTEWFKLGNLESFNIPAVVVYPGGGPMWFVNQWQSGRQKPAWETWFWNDVVSRISSRYHICSSRSDHSVAGYSMGGYASLYLASQRPSYFGSAGSFSGVNFIDSNEFTSYSPFYDLWGVPFDPYALAHDPTALAANLRHTRVLVEAGNGTTIGSEPMDIGKKYEELEFLGQSRSFVAAAQKAHVSVKFQVHAGIHTFPNWNLDLNNMLAWNPFKRVVNSPSSWTLATVSQSGNAWGYSWRFKHPVRVEIEFIKHGKRFEAEGSGQVTITTPAGQRVAAKLPFALVNGHLRSLRNPQAPLLKAGSELHVDLTISPKTVTGRQPVQVKFVTPERLPSSKQYEVALVSLTSGCNETVITAIRQSALGKRVTARLLPEKTASGAPGVWCTGTAGIGLTVAKRNGPLDLASLAQNIIGTGSVKLRG